jgi:hypothetical protein
MWRTRGAAHWWRGVSVNLSRSGVLLQSRDPGAVGDEVDLFITLSRDDAALYGVADVMCAGRVVRSARLRDWMPTWEIAVSIHTSHLVRGPE